MFFAEPWALVAILAFTIPITAIIVDGVKGIHQMRLKQLQHEENIERLRNGYPPVEIGKKRGKSRKHEEIIDMTNSDDSEIPQIKQNN
ncbi:MAG: hypothetical protein FWE91_02205 [Defluviitaleaceae bacterium]|nr:hypothetical protein [Defluviitaleaceae bacterium]MCL2835119.1 hypothetical protein [Defluviitaleaceae bacterium]